MNIIISNSSAEPIYAQIKNQLKHVILQGELQAGEMLPSIRQLAKDLHISVITTKRAYEELEKEGLIESVVGKGSYVSGHNREYIREQQLREWERHLIQVIEDSKNLQISWSELVKHMRLLYEEEKK
ncbi:hypothetical protein C2W64_03586 [Brevibacillus laterosporus]|nr:GntR family transcriptional regulator [Brevibacillus laterosporus]RAP22371.1 hypothetical protein C2W64_03586 [Brevibacillus laterosporus]